MDARAEAEKRYPDSTDANWVAPHEQAAFEAGAAWALREAANDLNCMDDFELLVEYADGIEDA